MPSPPSPWRSAALAALGFVLTLVFGKFTLIGAVKDVDASVFDAVVPRLQQIPGLVGFSEVVTQIGAISIDFVALCVLAFVAAFHYRRPLPAALVLAIGLGAHMLQKVTNAIVDGTVPTNDVIGSAGPYFSGGVVRVMVLTGIALTLAKPRLTNRHVTQGMVALGLLEAMTRLVLGRHWPLDLLASFPISLGIVWLFHQGLGVLAVDEPPKGSGGSGLASRRPPAKVAATAAP